MKKVEKYIYIILIIILVGVIASTTTYMLMKDKTEPKETENKPTENNLTIKEDGVKFVKAYEINDKIIEEFEITLNGQTKNVKVNFEYEYDSESYDGVHIIAGYINNNAIFAEEYHNKEKKEIFNLSEIKKILNEKNFSIIKGKDNKSYLIVSEILEVESAIHIFNDKFEILSNNIREEEITGRTGFNITYFYNNICGLENANPWYQDNFGVKNNDNHIHIKIENNEIYFLCPIIEGNHTSPSILEERVYTINNNKLEYKVINTYKVTSVCQEI